MLEVRLALAPVGATQALVTINRVDAVAGGLQAQAAATVREDDAANVSFETSGWFADALFSVFEVAFLDASGSQLLAFCPGGDHLFIQVRERGEAPLSTEGLKARLKELKQSQRELYGQPLGNPDAPGATKWQGVVVVEQLLLSTGLLLPGAEAQPTSIGNPGRSDAEILDSVMMSLEPRLDHPVTRSEWEASNERERPISVLLFPTVFARDLAEADALVRARRDELLGLLALKRRAAPRVLGTVLTEPAAGLLKVQLGVRPYRGNLMGGELAGESQLEFTRHDAAARQDPVMALALALMRDAHGESNDDFAYFRYWSILEVLSEHRVEGGKPVFRLSGEPLIGEDGQERTTKDKAPRVYVLVADWLRRAGFDETSLVSPAADLWEAIEVWYARRNATAHRGRFDPTVDDRYGRRSKAVKSLWPEGAMQDEWLARLRDTTTHVLEWEMSTGSVRQAP